MITRFFGVALCCLVLAGCVSGPVYRPAAKPGDYGYRDTQLTAHQYRVSFSANDGVARETVENFALFRAAQLALAHGADHFRVISRETSPVTETSGYGPSASIGYGFGYPFWGTGFGYGTDVVSRTRYETVLIIQIGPDVPRQGPNIFDANQIKQNLAPDVAARAR